MDEVEREVDQEIVDLEDEIAETYNQGYFLYRQVFTPPEASRGKPPNFSI